MSTAIQKFVNEKFNWEIRVVEINGELWFVGRDIAKALGYKDPKAAVRDLVDRSDKQLIQKGQYAPLANIPNRGLMFINESGLYSLVMSSKLPNAKAFKRWVTSEVLPSIRKTGMYIDPTAPIDPDLLIAIGQQMKALKQENEIMQPKAKYYDEVLNSSSLIPITRIAKEYGLSGQSLNRLLCKWEIQYKQGGVFVLYQDYANEGYAYYEDYPYIDDNGDTQTSQLLKWTQKGREFLHNVLTSNGYNRRKDLRNI